MRISPRTKAKPEVTSEEEPKGEARPNVRSRWWHRLVAGAAIQWAFGATIQTGVIIGAGFALMNFMLSGTNARIDGLQTSIVSQFETMNSRFESIEQRLTAMDQRLDGIAETQSEHTERFNSVDKEFESVRSELAEGLNGLRFSIERIDPTATEPLQNWGQLLFASLIENGRRDEARRLAIAFPGLFGNELMNGNPDVSSTTNSGDAPRESFEQIRRSIGIVDVRYFNREGTAVSVRATFFIINQDGYAITSNHIFDHSDGGPVEITASLSSQPRTKISANLVFRNEQADIAVIQLPRISGSSYPSIPLSRRAPSNGEELTAFSVDDQTNFRHFTSSALGLSQVIDLDRYVTSTGSQVPAGSSGAPVVDEHGRVVAVVRGSTSDGRVVAVGVSNFIDEVEDVLN